MRWLTSLVIALVVVSLAGCTLLTICPPGKTPKNIPPQTFSGKGQRVTPKFSLEAGFSIFRMKHQGSANWAPWLLNADGDRIELLANEIGKFEGEKAVGIPIDGIYVIDVTANGPWTINVTAE